MRRRGAEQLSLLLADLADHPRGRTDDQAAAFEALALGDQRPGTDDAFTFDHRAVQDARAHSDQAVVGNRAAVEGCLVSDRYAGADGEREIRVAMPDRTVLEVGFIA